jgi:hypothetical protein
MAERKLDTQSVNDMLRISQNQSLNFMPTDEKSWMVWQNAFANEFAIEFGGVKPPRKTTPKDMRDWAKKTYAAVKTQHMLVNMDINLDGDQMRSESHGHARQERTDYGDFWRIYAIYEDEHMRATNGWRTAKIKMTLRSHEGNPKLLDAPFALAKS